MITRMGISEGIGIAFFLTFPMVFMTTPGIIIEEAGSFGWGATLIGGFLAGIMFWILQSLLNNYPGGLLKLSEDLLGKFFGRMLGLFYACFIFAVACIWTRQFSENTLLTALPHAEFKVITYMYVVCVIVLVYLGIEAIARAASLFLPLALVSCLLVFSGLIPITNINYVFPILGKGLQASISPILLVIGSSAPAITIMYLAPHFQSENAIKSAIIFGVGGGVLIRALSIFIFTISFSSAAAQEKILPFYEMAKLIYLNHYIQRIEAIFILLWAAVGIFGIALGVYSSLYIIARILNLPTVNPLLPPIGIILISISSMPPDTGMVLKMAITLFSKILAPGFILSILVLVVAHKLKGGAKRET